VEGFDILFALAVGNQGVTIVPGLPNSPPPIGLVERPLERKPSDPKYLVRAVWLKNETSPAVKNFIDALKPRFRS
jgi:DNA-binding transcriptional LysR family regulator